MRVLAYSIWEELMFLGWSREEEWLFILNFKKLLTLN